MGLSFFETIIAHLRGIPLKKHKQALRKAEEAGFKLSAIELLAHMMAGGNAEAVVDALILAKDHDIGADFDMICAIDLARHDPLEAVKRSIPVHELTFDHYTADGEESIAGICKNGASVSTACTIRYRIPIGLPIAFQFRIDHVQERLATRLSVMIHTAADLSALLMRQSQHEAELLVLAKNMLETIQQVEVRFPDLGIL